jgi:hypothetical protein
MESIIQPKYSLGRIHGKFLMLELFVWAKKRPETMELMFKTNRQFRQLLV